MHPSLLVLFLFIFLGMWLSTTTILGLMSGWFALQRRYPRGDEQPLLTLRRRSGMMGLGVNLGGVLTLSTCASGLRIGIWRLFGPFQRPFLVPWSDIETKSARTLFVPAVKLVFGAPETGSLKIDAWTWQRLVAACPNAPRDAVAPVTFSRMALGIVLEWAVLSLAAGAFSR